MLDVPLVVYTHTDNLDCLNIATDYLKEFDDKILIINNTDINLDQYKLEYRQIIFYEDQMQYGQKLFNTLKQINSDYILFSHEIDILLDKDIKTLNALIEYARFKNIDRINLQPSGHNGPLYTKVLKNEHPSLWEDTETFNTEDLYLSEQKGITTYRYNVNPTIVNLKSFIDMVGNFQNTSYRDMEDLPVQQYCEALKVYNLYKNKTEECGYFKCVSEYKFFHITHHRAFVRYDENSPSTKFGQSYKDCLVDYQNIISKYKLLEKSRNFT
jgi:hypothetical protein